MYLMIKYVYHLEDMGWRLQSFRWGRLVWGGLVSASEMSDPGGVWEWGKTAQCRVTVVNKLCIFGCLFRPFGMLVGG